MSTETKTSGGRAARRAFVAIALAGAASAIHAADVDFRPVMTFGLFHNGNISVVGGKHGDNGAALAFDLAVDLKTPTSSLTFSYRPSYVAYQTSKDLDYFGNTIVLGFAQDYSHKSRFVLDFYLARTDYQGQTPTTADQAKSFVPRTTLTEATLKIGGTVGAGRRSYVDWQVRGGTDLYKDLEDNPATPDVVDPVNFNDSTGFAGRLAWRSEISAKNTLGLGLDAGQVSYEITPSVGVASFGLVGTSTPGPSWTVNYAAGGSRAVSDGDSIDGFSCDVRAEYTGVKATTFGAGVRQVFSPGTGLGAATQDRGVWLSYAHGVSARGLSGSVVGGYWQRDSLKFASAPATGDSAAFSLNGTIGWSFNRYLALNGTYEFIDQSARNGADPSLNTNYSSYGLFLRWAIRGR